MLGRIVARRFFSATHTLRGQTDPHKIGIREVVGHGMNGQSIYVDSYLFPYPAIRFKEITPVYKALKEKEKGDWRSLSIEEKKTLYRISFCQTFSELSAPTGQWKVIVGSVLIVISLSVILQIVTRRLNILRMEDSSRKNKEKHKGGSITEEMRKNDSKDIKYKPPQTCDLADLMNYIPRLLSNMVVSYEVIEKCFHQKLVDVFQKCLVESKFQKVVEGIPAPGACEMSDEELDALENVLKKRFKFSSNLNPYENMPSIIEDCDNVGEFYKTKRDKMLFIPHVRKNRFPDPVVHENKAHSGVSREIFAHSLDGFHFIWFLNRLQTFTGKETHCQIICMQHLKSIALFTCLIDIPVPFIHFLFEETTDNFLRALAVYFQYFLQLWDVCLIRSEIRRNKLNSPKSNCTESRWQKNLNDMRFFIARNYIIMIIGAKSMQKYHRINGKSKMQCNDIVLYELLYTFSAQIMLMIFNHDNDKIRKNIIKDEIDKLFRLQEKGVKDLYEVFSKTDRAILEGGFYLAPKVKEVWSTRCLAEIKRPGRDKKILYAGTSSIIVSKNKKVRVLQSALLVPEEKLEVANIKLGILGKPRADYPPLLNCTRITMLERNEGINVEGEKDEDVRLRVKEHNYEKPVLVTKEFPEKPYNTDYCLLIKKKQSNRKTVKMWERYARTSDRFWYVIDPDFTIVGHIKERFKQIFEDQVQKKAAFEKRIRLLLQNLNNMGQN